MIPSIRLFTLLVVASMSTFCHAAEYDRSQFRHWSDLDKNGHNSRYEALMSGIVGGVLCPYTGQVLAPSEKVDIDHIVPLAYAWNHGAEAWTDLRREQFANDPENLLAVSADVNRAKGAKPPAEWLPPNLRYVPRYIERFTKICVKYSLECDFVGLSSQFTEYSKVRNGVRP